MAECFFSALLRPSMQTNEMIYLLMFLIRVRGNEYGLKPGTEKKQLNNSLDEADQRRLGWRTWLLRNKAVKPEKIILCCARRGKTHCFLAILIDS